MKSRMALAVVAWLTVTVSAVFPQERTLDQRSKVPMPSESSEAEGRAVTADPVQAPQKPPPMPREKQVNAPYTGAVTEITKDSITIQWLESPGEKPRTFALTQTLAAGEIPKKNPFTPGTFVTAPEMYRLTDVKVGDWVLIGYVRWNGTDICHNISIVKRPGGRVPPLPEEAEKLRWPESHIAPKNLAAMPPDLLEKIRASRPIPYHEYWNAYWDLKDKGIPFPEKFGPNRRFPVAPPPRAVPERRPIQ